MKKNIRFFTHTSVMWALFILGNAVIALPAADADEFTFLGYLAACGLGLLLNLIALPAAKRPIPPIFLWSAAQTARQKAGSGNSYIPR